MSKKQSMSVGEVLNSLHRFAPPGTAEPWDNVGLLAGDPEWRTSGAIVSVDLTREAIDLAEKRGFRLIVNHHPCIFPKNRGLSRVVSPGTSSHPGGLVFEAIHRGIAVIASHTNFDQSALEVIKLISEAWGVHPQGRLLEKPAEALLKLVVFVPESHAHAVREALAQAGAGHVGNYDSCSFSTQGEGRFRGNAHAQPFLGQVGKIETASETRIETVLPRGLVAEVLKAMRAAHPYEEIAYDLSEVKQPASGVGLVRGMGYGFWGDFPKPRTFSDLSHHVKSLFETDGFWITDPVPSRVKRIAFVAGKGASFIPAAIEAGCDLFITGEAGYHAALDGSKRGMAILELGHRESERLFLRVMSGWLKAWGLKTVEQNLPIQKIWLGD